MSHRFIHWSPDIDIHWSPLQLTKVQFYTRFQVYRLHSYFSKQIEIYHHIDKKQPSSLLFHKTVWHRKSDRIKFSLTIARRTLLNNSALLVFAWLKQSAETNTSSITLRFEQSTIVKTNSNRTRNCGCLCALRAHCVHWNVCVTFVIWYVEKALSIKQSVGCYWQSKSKKFSHAFPRALSPFI